MSRVRKGDTVPAVKRPDLDGLLTLSFRGAGLTAARNTKPVLLQNYHRDMGGGRFVMLKEVDAPITVRGRHWGGLRLAYRLR